MDTDIRQNDKSRPLVSYIMTAKNTEKFIDEAINSIVHQTYRNLELVVVDDASTDRTTEIIKSWSAKDPRVKAIYNKVSILPPLARNSAAKAARGKYLAILDSDDVCFPERTAKQVSFLENHPEMAAACSHAEIIDVNGKSLGIKKKSCNISDIRFAMLLQSQFIHSSMMIRKSVFDEFGGYRPEFMHAEDYDIYTRVLERYQMTNLNEILIKFRANSGGVTTQSDSQKIQAESSLKITLRNTAPYISLSPEKTKILTDVMNNKKVPLVKTLGALVSYRKITMSYIGKNNMRGNERKMVLEIYRNKLKSVVVDSVKRCLYI